MFGNRRLAKRSIVGTKVCALWKDGRFYPGVITDHPGELGIVDEAKYTVVFDDGFQKRVSSTQIIGTGFQSVSTFRLNHGQLVYLTLNGREVPGYVNDHDAEKDCVTIDVQINGDSYQVQRNIEDVRLLESRKSARLVDQDTDYSKLADVVVHSVTGSESKKRPVSHVIDVPTGLNPRHRRSADDERGVSAEEEGEGMDVEMMDERIAAMVLTSLSTSPVSPNWPNSLKDTQYRPSQHLSSSVSSSGFHSERSDPSPPSSHLSESAPASSTGFFPTSYTKDDEIDIDIDEEDEDFDDVIEPRKRLKILGHRRKMLFRCTWKGCNKKEVTRPEIERHVRTAHLGCNDSDSDLSDHEEEFYYTEIEENVDNVTKKFSEMCTASPPDHFFGDIDTSSGHVVVPDHDYQKKNQYKFHPSSVPSSGFFKHGMTTPPSMPEIRRSLSWQNTDFSSSPISPTSQPIRMSKPSPQERLQQHQSQSPKSHSHVISAKSGLGFKKPRSEVRKCRKVYGMENRDMWCTQCKWKKACSRFVD
ncbi:hypothetical protein FSP39_017343 [Pinctada imbricata]|uniref:C2H2-type domain-containing protein n=1 Tax=Pinctada imbricata TaxID=66713 RepID=A0AA88XW40_PINIB|nr:hypothetical protein FSP39_017343 [Pinctada imbricata]